MADEVEGMQIWQDHERRITTLENTFSQYGNKIENVERHMSQIEGKIDENGRQQKELLDKLIKHHLDTDTLNKKGKWKLVITIASAIFGTGGIITVLIYALL